jgi:hypothetical protein
MLSLQAEAIVLDLDGSSAPEVSLGGRNRRGLAAAWVSQSRSSVSNGFLALFGSRPWCYFYPRT